MLLLTSNRPEDIKKFLVQQIIQKLDGEKVLFYDERKGTDFIEIGPGKVLSGLVKRIYPTVIPLVLIQ